MQFPAKEGYIAQDVGEHMPCRAVHPSEWTYVVSVRLKPFRKLFSAVPCEYSSWFPKIKRQWFWTKTLVTQSKLSIENLVKRTLKRLGKTLKSIMLLALLTRHRTQLILLLLSQTHNLSLHLTWKTLVSFSGLQTHINFPKIIVSFSQIQLPSEEKETCMKDERGCPFEASVITTFHRLRKKFGDCSPVFWSANFLLVENEICSDWCNYNIVAYIHLVSFNFGEVIY